ncbi:MAG: hypothetical protein QM628_15580 [Propionicimonas sp.]
MDKKTLRWVLVVIALIVVLISTVNLLLGSLSATPSEGSLTSAIIATVLFLGFSGMSTRRVQQDLKRIRGQSAGRRRAGDVERMASAGMHTSTAGGIALRGVVRGSSDLLDWMSSGLAALMAVVATGWWANVRPDGWPEWVQAALPWVLAVAFGAGGGSVLAHRASAAVSADLQTKESLRSIPGWIAAAIAGTAAGLGTHAGLTSWLGRAPELQIDVAVGAMAAAFALGFVSVLDARRARKLMGKVASRVAAATGITETKLLEPARPIRWRAYANGSVTIWRPPAGVLLALEDGSLDRRLGMVWAEVEIAVGAGAEEVRFVPASKETQRRRELAAQGVLVDLAAGDETMPDLPAVAGVGVPGVDQTSADPASATPAAVGGRTVLDELDAIDAEQED